jgi:hypothetical protein
MITATTTTKPARMSPPVQLLIEKLTGHFDQGTGIVISMCLLLDCMGAGPEDIASVWRPNRIADLNLRPD